MKKILILLLICIGMFMFITSQDTELEKIIINNGTEYDKIILKERDGFKRDIMELELVENTKYCFSNCEAVIKINTTRSVEDILRELEFKDIFGNKRDINNQVNFISYEKYNITINDYGKENCIIAPNLTEICTREIIGSHTEERTRKVITKPYALDGNVLSGVYYIQIKGTKDAFEDIDFIPNIAGFEISEWAWWLSPSPIHYWKFDENGGSANDSAGFINLSQHDGAIPRVSGKFGNAVEVSGTSSLRNTSDYIDIMGHGAFTIALWVNTTDIANSDYAPIFSTGDIEQGTRGIQLHISNNQLSFNIRNISGAGGNQEILSSENINSGNAMQLVVITKAIDNYTQIYINGTMTANTTSIKNISGGSLKTFFLGRNDGGKYPKNETQIDDFAIYNVSATKDDVADLWNSGDGRTHDAVTITLNSPINYYNSSNLNVTFNCSASHDTNFHNLSLYIDGKLNETNNNITDFISIEVERNLTNGLHNWTCFAVDSSNAETRTANRTLNLDNTAPTINILFPVNYTAYLTNQTELNYSVSDDNIGLDTCWWSNDTGMTNVTHTCRNNVTGMNSTDGGNYWRVYANDTLGNEGYYESYFFVDSLAPNVTINTPSGTLSTLSFNVNVTARDDFNISYCYFNITRGASIEVGNTQLNPINFTELTSVTSEANYVCWVACNDTLNHINITNSSFSVSVSSGGTTGGGGGGFIEKVFQPITSQVCDDLYPDLQTAWEIFLEDRTWENFKGIWFSFWNYSLCKNSASFIPLEMEIINSSA